MKFLIARSVRRVLAWVVAWSSGDSQEYLRYAGIDVDGLLNGREIRIEHDDDEGPWVSSVDFHP